MRKIQIRIANITHTIQVVSFFSKNIDCTNSGIYSEEFLCPFGIKAAIRRKQMVVAIVDGQVVGAFRFYRKKTTNSISLYQFAISKKYRGQGLFNQMLKTIHDAPIVSLCPTDSEFNNYYYKSGWHLQERSEKYTIWVFTD